MTKRKARVDYAGYGFWPLCGMGGDYPHQVDGSSVNSLEVDVKITGSHADVSVANSFCMIIEFAKPVDRRLDRMIEIADELDCPLDHVVAYMGRCSQTTFLAFSDNPATLPRYRKSKVSSY